MNKLKVFSILAACFIVLSLGSCDTVSDLIGGNNPGNGGTTQTFTVTFNANGGTGTVPGSQTVNAGSSVTIPSGDSLTKEGFSFGGWNTKADGTEINYPAGTSLIVTGNITLYAKWDGEGIITPTTYTIAFNANGGIGTIPGPYTVNAGSSITTPYWDGTAGIDFTNFSGWNTKADGSGVNFLVNEPIMPSGDITLYAKWVTVMGLANKLAWLKDNAQSNGSYTIELTADETVVNEELSYLGKDNITIILRGIGSNRTISLSSNGRMFTVNIGVTLVLDTNITLQGRSSNNTSLVWVEGGNLIMNTGAVITGNNTNYYGGGVEVARGVFTMNGGTISGNTAGNGGGVYVVGVAFIMNGGSISGNTAIGGGGGVYVMSRFDMNGGTISGNAAENGGGVCLSSGRFIMSGGIITGNTAASNTPSDGGGGVYLSFGSSFTKWSDGTGIITGYASDPANGNVVKDKSGVVQSDRGHAVYAGVGKKKKETTAKLEDFLNCDGTKNPQTFNGDWDD